MKGVSEMRCTVLLTETPPRLISIAPRGCYTSSIEATLWLMIAHYGVILPLALAAAINTHVPAGA